MALGRHRKNRKVSLDGLTLLLDGRHATGITVQDFDNLIFVGSRFLYLNCCGYFARNFYSKFYPLGKRTSGAKKLTMTRNTEIQKTQKSVRVRMFVHIGRGWKYEH